MTVRPMIQSGAPRAAALLVLAAVSLVAACRKGDASAVPAKAEAVLVGPENVAVIRSELIRTGPALSGSLAPLRTATIRAEMSGAVLQTSAEPGQSVRAGQALAQIDAAVLRDLALSAKSAVLTAQSGADIAKREVSRSGTRRRGRISGCE